MTAPPAPTAPPPPRGAGPDHPTRRRSRGWWPAVLALVVVGFLAAELPAYVTLDPATSRIPPRPGYPPHYALLVGHILFGSVALLAGCLQVWPWLRCRRPAVHRWAGRVYLFGGVFPAGVLVLGVAPVSSTGFVSSVGNTLLAVLWLLTSAAGYRAARRRRFTEHRAWMLRSMALTCSIVVNRGWLVLFLIVLTPFTDSAFGGSEAAMVRAAAGGSVWCSWVVNLLVVEWWLLRPRPARARVEA